ncbi:MAG: hypothetical protein HRU26_04870, partial [Psychroserpens sp.]|nr:hypothetical protein [Psychroserpens sp.]
VDSILIEFRGKIEFIDSKLQPTNIELIQSNKIFRTISDSNGRYCLKGKVDLENSFIVEFTADRKLTKTVSFDIGKCGIELGNSVYKPLEAFDMSMISINESLEPLSFNVARFFCHKGGLKLNSGYVTMQQIKIHNYLLNIDSTEIQYYDNESLKSLIPMDGSGLNGKAVFYFQNGDIQKEIDFENDMINGRIVKYYEGGNIKSIEYYKLNELIKYERYLNTEDNSHYRTYIYQ